MCILSNINLGCLFCSTGLGIRITHAACCLTQKYGNSGFWLESGSISDSQNIVILYYQHQVVVDCIS